MLIAGSEFGCEERTLCRHSHEEGAIRDLRPGILDCGGSEQNRYRDNGPCLQHTQSLRQV